jgi:Domain of unknown function (DUF3127)
MYETSGTIKLINDIQSFASGFTKREFVVTTGDKYPQDLKFEVVKDKCAMLDAFEPGQSVQVSFDIRGNEYNGKYFVNLSAWKIQAAGESSAATPARASASPQGARLAPATAAEPSMGDLRNNEDFDDDVPF